MLRHGPLNAVQNTIGWTLSRRFLVSSLGLVLLGLSMQDAIAGDSKAGSGKEAPLLALHVDEWTPSFGDFFLAVAAGGLAVKDSGTLSPEFSPGVTTYTARVAEAPGALGRCRQHFGHKGHDRRRGSRRRGLAREAQDQSRRRKNRE